MLSLLGSLRGGSSFITNSLRFRSSASAYLSRTPSVAGNRRTFTWSGWVKRGTLNTQQVLFGAFGDLTFGFGLNSAAGGDGDYLLLRDSGSSAYYTATTGVFRDVSAWYHIVLSVDTNLTASDRVRIYVNGIRQSDTGTPIGSGVQTAINNTVEQSIGRRSGASNIYYFDGYLTDVNFIDGQALTPASFGAIDSSTGVWAPSRYTGTYGTNGFYLKFANTSSVAALGTDSSGNGNTWTVNNVLLTAGATYDSMIDVPMNYGDGGNGRGNYSVLNPLDKVTTATLAAANLETTSASAQNVIGSISMDSGGWYWEIAYSAATASQLIGVYKSAATTASITPTTSVIGLRFNAGTGALDYTVNGSTYTSIATGLTGGGYFPYAGSLTNAKIIYANFGQRPFAYTPPAGFLALNTNNLPTPSIVNGANFMAATTYTGNAAARSLSNAVNSVSFRPDLVWIKSRTPGATNHALFDSVRGATKYLSSNTTAAETTLAQSLTAFNADGFSLGTDTTLVNANANSYVAWQWKAGGTAVSNTQGTITSQVSANTTTGFSIVTYAGASVQGSTVGHGLGVAPSMIIIKLKESLGGTRWPVYHKFSNAVPQNYRLELNQASSASADSSNWNNTAPTSSVFTIGNASENNLIGNTYVAYCFADVAGFSRFGSYTGNGSADGPFVYCGFRPRFVMFKNASVGSTFWLIYDTTRNSYNVMNFSLQPESAGAEVVSGGWDIDILSNGFKLRNGGTSSNNGTGNTIIFAAFAEVPSKYALAR